MTNSTEAWINIYKHKNSYWCGNPNHTKSEALLHLADTENYLTTVNIEQLLKLQEENTKLKELLEEYKDITATAMLYTKSDEEYAKAKTVRERIDQVLADNQIQANTVACNKIQENK